MKSLFTDYSDLMRSGVNGAMDPRLLVKKEADLEVYYAPFDYVNMNARIVVVV